MNVNELLVGWEWVRMYGFNVFWCVVVCDGNGYGFGKVFRLVSLVIGVDSGSVMVDDVFLCRVEIEWDVVVDVVEEVVVDGVGNFVDDDGKFLDFRVDESNVIIGGISSIFV